MSWIDDDFVPDPKRLTRHKGVLFNPWLNISVCAGATFLCAGVAAYMVFYMMENLISQPSGDGRGTELIALVIVAVFSGLLSILMLVVTFLTALVATEVARVLRTPTHPSVICFRVESVRHGL